MPPRKKPEANKEGVQSLHHTIAEPPKNDDAPPKKTAGKPELLLTRKNAFDILTTEQLAAAQTYCEGYKAFLNKAKTEREAVAESIRLAEAAGFRPIGGVDSGKKPEPGAKVYKSLGGKSLLLAVVGKNPVTDGIVFAGAHIDSPRLDLKQTPLYEDGEMALFKTHYYGGIKKYQWVALPLALHGVVVKTDGTAVNITIGEDENEPTFIITDLLPHLGKDQNKKTLGEAFTGENLNILIGSRPAGEEKDASRFKLTILEILYSKYGITEEDFLSAEIEAVPAGRARDVGFDRSLIAAYGHDDRSCAYATLRAVIDRANAIEKLAAAAAAASTAPLPKRRGRPPKALAVGLDTATIPDKTVVAILSDREEVGSMGVTGSQSSALELFVSQLAGGLCFVAQAFEKSFCLSSDVCNAFDPNFPDVSEKNNAARINYGIGIMKHTGSGGKSNSSEASAELVAYVRRIFKEKGVIWQMGELGKVDQGGGGTIAQYMANRNIQTIDAGVPVLSMHAPWEVVSKLDCYMTYKGVLAVYEA
ncbi:MAG: aminopeptidase 1 [Oscillospiraceae bacterium]|jgi:aspartyl aminopeptidase|nr:aminopeptidase 1 [Oscillospiraceae bacterium]